MENPIMNLSRLIKNQRFKEPMVIYILFNLGILLILYGTFLYSPAMVPDVETLSPEYARMELINISKGVFISQEFQIDQYNIGFDMMNLGGIFLMVGLLFHNSILASHPKEDYEKRKLKVYKLRKKGSLQGNLLEWLCLVVFSFAFFTFFHNIFVYIIITSMIIGVIGYTIRKFQMVELIPKLAHV
ncbi:hypothetical protein [[Eubacterium] cellulosolvens]